MNALSPVLRSGEIYREEIARLRGKIELLEEENRQLRETLVRNIPFPAEWRLGPSRSAMLSCLYGAADGYRNIRALYVAMLGLCSDTGEKIVQVQMCLLRKRIAELGLPIEIETVWGLGYRLSVTSRVYLNGILSMKVAA